MADAVIEAWKLMTRTGYVYPLPSSVSKLTDRQLRFSLKGIQEYIEEKRHAGTHVQARQGLVD